MARLASFVVLGLVALASLVSVCSAVDRSKFRTCEQTHFCRKNRGGEFLRASPRVVGPMSTSVDGHPANTAIRFDLSKAVEQDTRLAPHVLAGDNNEDAMLDFQLHSLSPNVFRVRISESNDAGRYQGPQEFITLPQDAERAPLNFTQDTPEAGVGVSAHFSQEGTDVSGSITGGGGASDDAGESFRMSFFVGEERVLSINKLGLFGFEQRRTREQDESACAAQQPDGDATRPEEWDEASQGTWNPPMVDHAASKDRWEESFSSWTDVKRHGPQDISMDFVFHNAKHVYGLPEHADSHSLRSTAPPRTPTTQDSSSPNQDDNNGEGEGDDDGDQKPSLDPYRLYNLDVFEYELSETMSLYGAVPFIIGHSDSGQSVGVFWFNSAETWVDVGDITMEHIDGDSSSTSTSNDGGDKPSFLGSLFGGGSGGDGDALGSKYAHFMSESGAMDIFILLGPTPLDVIGQYASLTGVAPLPPKFAVAYHQCKWNYKSQAEVAEVDGSFDEHDIPYDVLWLDIEHTKGKRYFTYDLDAFPQPSEMIEGLASKGRKMVNIIDPHIKKDNGYHVYDAFSQEGLFVRNSDGQGDFEGTCWPGDSKWIDYLNPRATQLWAEHFQYDRYDYSSPDVFVWNDMNEPSVFSGPEVTMDKSAVHHGDVEHRDVHNAYGLYQHRATFDGLLARNAAGDARPFVLTRSFFPGSQRYSAIWTGDNEASWGHLAISVPMLLSLNVGGISFCGADVGGFFGNTEVELLTRWYQAGAYQPFFRAHGILEARRKEPFLFDEPHRSMMRDAIRARYRILPYVYTAFRDHASTRAPVMRPVWTMYPGESATFGLDDQYVLGSDMLVKPITTEGASSTTVYLPGDQPWYDGDSGRAYAGEALGTRVSVDAPLHKIPVFYRGGSIIPMRQRPRRCSAAMANDPYTLVVSLDAHGGASGRLYVDDGWSYNYTHGAYAHRQFSLGPDGVLRNDPVPHDHGDLVVHDVIERIVLYGFNGTPESTTAVAKIAGDEHTRNIELYADEWGNTCMRKPSLPLGVDWEVKITKTK